jgi:hypothetical protein
MSSKYTRASAIIALTPAATMVDKEGYGCTFTSDTATISSSGTVICTGIILEGAATTGKASIGIIGALSGPVRVCLGGAVTKGAALVQHTDGTWITDPTSGARVKSWIALETGVAGQLIEAANLTPVTLS